MSDEAVVTMAGDEPIRARFPVHVTAFGIPSVLIPEADYCALVERSAAIAKTGRLSQLDKDPEVRAFILERAGTDDMDRIRDAALAHFGADRVPSRSAINRAVVRSRTHQGSDRPGGLKWAVKPLTGRR